MVPPKGFISIILWKFRIRVRGPAFRRYFQVWPFCLLVYCRKAIRIKFGLLSGSLEIPREIPFPVKPLFYFLHRHAVWSAWCQDNWGPSFVSLWHLHSPVRRLREGVVRPKPGEPWGPLFPWPPQFLHCWYFLGSWGWWGWRGWRSNVIGSWSGSLTEASGCWCQ